MAIILHTFDLVWILAAEWFVHIVRVSCVHSSFYLITMSLAFCDDLFSSYLILLHHFNCEDVIDFDVVSWKTVVQEIRREHHIVARVPEFRVVLSVKPVDISRSDKSKSAEHHHAAEEVHKDTWVVQRTILHSQESWEDWAHHAHLLVDHNPEVINNSESTKHCVGAVLTFTHLKSSADATKKATSWSHSLIVCSSFWFKILKMFCAVTPED